MSVTNSTLKFQATNYYLLGKGGYFSVVLVCLSVSGQHSSKNYERIVMKFYGGIRVGKRKKLNFGGDLGLLR